MIDLKRKQDCCGCSACVQKCPKQCISLKEDPEGFLYPQTEENVCIDCGLCEKVCPVINRKEECEPMKVYAAKNPDEEIRMQSSSGGIFTLLARQVIREKGVVFGARFDECWNVVHDCTETIEGLTAFRGSKYVQSRIGETYLQARRFLRQGRKVLFSGTPCQIAGLRLFLKEEYAGLLTVDLVCHGVPSPKIWQKYLDEVVARKGVAGKNTVSSHPLKEKKAITEINFRDKRTGWKKYSFALTLSELSSEEKNSVLLSSTFEKNPFMKGFLANLYLRPSCYACPAKSGKSGADITIADFWGIQHELPQFDDDKGVGLVLINTAKGNSYYSNLEVENIEVGLDQGYKYNTSLKKSVGIPAKKKEFWEKIENENIFRLIDRLTKKTWTQRCKQKIKSILKKVL